MARLSALLLSNGVCTEQQIADAMRQQVILGGRLGTNLVELGHLDEATLARYLAKRHGTAALFGDRLRPDPKALQLLPRATVDRLNVIPYRLRQEQLQLLCLDPAKLNTFEEVTAKTGYRVEPIVVPELRFAKLLATFYRIHRGVRGLTLDEPVAATPAAAPPQAAATLDHDLMPEETFDRLYQAAPETAPEPPPEPSPLRPAPVDSSRFGAPGSSVASPRSAADGDDSPFALPTLDPSAHTPYPIPPPPLDSPFAAPAVQPAGPPESFLTTGVHLDVHADQDLPLLSGDDLEEVVVGELLSGEALPSYDVMADGPVTFAMATELLTQAQDRDQVAHTVLRFAVSLFERAMLFTVHRRWIIGWDAVGRDVDRMAFRKLVILLDEPSLFATVVQSRAHYLGGLQKTPSNISFLRAMGKKVPLSAFAMPVLVQGRVVNILYGDNGHKSHCPSDVGELLILALKISQSYEALFQARWEAHRPR